jgi:hypothetical protein
MVKSPATPELMEERAHALREAQEAQARHASARSDAAEASASRRTALLAAYEAGVTMPELSEALGMSPEAISKAIGRPNGPKPRRATAE